MILLRCYDILDAILSDDSGRYLSHANFDACDGMGDFIFTDDKDKAMRFPSLEAAMEFWKTQSTIRPLRDDGQPNRPLTAFSAAFETLEG